MKRYRVGVVGAGILLVGALACPSPARATAPNADSDFPTQATARVLLLVPATEVHQDVRSGGIQTRRLGTNATIEAAKEGTLLDFSGFKNWGGSQAAVQGFNTVIARTEDDWKQLWSMTGAPAPWPMPQGIMAVGIFLGERPSEGYVARISTIRQVEETDSLMITYIEYKPRLSPLVNTGEADPNRPKASPWVIYQLPMTQGPIRFFKQTRTR